MTPAVKQAVLFKKPFPGASFGYDFTTNRGQLGSQVYRDVTSIPGWSFTRASTGYAETAAGALVAFASGVPRITDKGFLVERARTNYTLRSQEIDNASWIKTNMAVTADDTLAPDGTMTADKIYVSAAASGTTIYQNVTPGAGTTITASIYAKKGTSATVVNQFGIRDSTAGVTLLVFTVNYDTLAVTYSTGSSGVTVQQCANGWIRIVMTLAWTSGNVVRTYTGYTTGVQTLNDYAYVWGAQVEVGDIVSSYIPTTTASVTRAEDLPTITAPADLLTQGTLVTSTIPPSVMSATSHSFTSMSSTTSGVSFAFPVSLSGSLTRHRRNANSVAGTNIDPANTFTPGARTKTAGTWGRAGGDGACLNGGTVAAAALPVDPFAINEIRPGRYASNPSSLWGYVERIVCYPTTFTDSQLQAASA